VNFDDQDWEAAPPSAGVARGISTAWKVAAGVAFGMVLGGALVYVLERQRAPAAAAAATPPIERMMQDKPPAAGNPTPSPQDAEPQAPPLPQPALPAPQPANPSASEAAAAEASLNGEPEAEAALRAARRAAERKDRAWADFYKKPAMCDEYTSRDVMVECANQYIRARHEFEENYSVGRR
jgi:type IV secretory pathway VirB10-like protein